MVRCCVTSVFVVFLKVNTVVTSTRWCLMHMFAVHKWWLCFKAGWMISSALTCGVGSGEMLWQDWVDVCVPLYGVNTTSELWELFCAALT